MSWIAVGIGAAVGATGGAIIGSKKGGDDVWKGALLGGVLGAAGGGIGGAAFGGGAAAAEGAGGAALGGAAEGTALGGAAAAGESTGIAGLAGAGGTTIPGIGTAAAAPIAGTTTAAIPGTVIAGTGAGGASGMLGGAGVAGLGGAATPIAGTTAATLPGTAVAGGAGSAGAGAGGAGAGGSGIGGWWGGLGNAEKAGIIGAGTVGLGALMNRGNSSAPTTVETYSGPLSEFKYSPSTYSPTYAKPNVYTATYAEGGITGFADGGQMDPMNPIQNPIYPQSQQDHTNFATSTQYPNSIASAMGADYDARTNPMTGSELPMGMAEGGIASLGGYSDGGQLLKGPGDGVSDSIPASIGRRQPARLADGEFVVPARAVSELGNGSTDAGAKQLYSMLDRIEHKRKKGKGLAYQANPKKMLPA